jgi:hypothetical protein
MALLKQQGRGEEQEKEHSELAALHPRVPSGARVRRQGAVYEIVPVAKTSTLVTVHLSSSISIVRAVPFRA